MYIAPQTNDLSMSEMEKEARKWDTPQSQGGYRPDSYQPYPKMLYRAVRADGKIKIDDNTVNSEAEAERAARDGWVMGGPDKALAKLSALEDDIAQAAAETAFNAQKMGPKAKREFDRREAATDKHVTE